MHPRQRERNRERARAIRQGLGDPESREFAGAARRVLEQHREELRRIGQRLRVPYTVGHSDHPLERLLEMLQRQGVDTVVDVRRHPGSRHAPQYNRDALEDALDDVDVEYRWLGDSLGEPDGAEWYDAAGALDVPAVQALGQFRQGMEQLVYLLADPERTVCLLCAEEDPRRCHRHTLIGRTLYEQFGVRPRHIRAGAP